LLEQANRDEIRPRHFAPIALVLVAIFMGMMGNFRVVSGTEQILVRRSNYGFSDMFASVATCTTGPWLAVSATHGPLCHDLQDAGILESDEARAARATREVQRVMEESRKQAEAIMRRR
jgi:hypothetical protein